MWKKYIQWEKSNPMETEEYGQFAKRGGWKLVRVADTFPLLESLLWRLWKKLLFENSSSLYSQWCTPTSSPYCALVIIRICGTKRHCFCSRQENSLRRKAMSSLLNRWQLKRCVSSHCFLNNLIVHSRFTSTCLFRTIWSSNFGSDEAFTTSLFRLRWFWGGENEVWQCKEDLRQSAYNRSYWSHSGKHPVSLYKWLCNGLHSLFRLTSSWWNSRVEQKVWELLEQCSRELAKTVDVGTTSLSLQH